MKPSRCATNGISISLHCHARDRRPATVRTGSTNSVRSHEIPDRSRIGVSRARLPRARRGRPGGNAAAGPLGHNSGRRAALDDEALHACPRHHARAESNGVLHEPPGVPLRSFRTPEDAPTAVPASLRVAHLRHRHGIQSELEDAEEPACGGMPASTVPGRDRISRPTSSNSSSRSSPRRADPGPSVGRCRSRSSSSRRRTSRSRPPSLLVCGAHTSRGTGRGSAVDRTTDVIA